MEDAARLATEREVPVGERDEELALAARSDPAAFGILYGRHRLAVFRYLRTRTSSEDQAAGNSDTSRRPVETANRFAMQAASQGCVGSGPGLRPRRHGPLGRRHRSGR